MIKVTSDSEITDIVVGDEPKHRETRKRYAKWYWKLLNFCTFGWFFNLYYPYKMTIKFDYE